MLPSLRRSHYMGFLKPQRPCRDIGPDIEVISELLEIGWVGQAKINGRRAQVHIHSNKIMAFTRYGQLHTRKLGKEVTEQLLEFKPKKGTNIFDCEWCPSIQKMFVFDMLVHEGKSLRFLKYMERHNKLNEMFRISPNVEFLRLVKTTKQCQTMLNKTNPFIEGLVFRYKESKGWPDTAIIRCRKVK